MEKKYKIFSMIFMWIFGIITLGGFVFIALLWLYDPFWLFHKPLFRPTTYHSDMRIQAKGIIDSAEFDSVILGSSMLENLSTKEANEKLGGRWVNLSMGGAHPVERAVIMEYLLKAKSPKRILYSFDTHSMVLDKAMAQSIKPALYSNDFATRMRFYFNERFIKCAFKWSKSAECVGGKKELQTIPSEFYAKCIKEAGFLNWCQFGKVSNYLRKADEVYEAEPFIGSIAKSQNLINKYILDFARANPKVEFHFAISAYSRFYYRVRIDDGYVPNPKQHFDKWRKILIWIVNETQNLPNVRIYGFDDLELSDNVENYIDQGHYRIGSALNSIALDSMRDRAHILTPQNVENYMDAFEKRVKDYDIKTLRKKLDAWENK